MLLYPRLHPLSSSPPPFALLSFPLRFRRRNAYGLVLRDRVVSLIAKVLATRAMGSTYNVAAVRVGPDPVPALLDTTEAVTTAQSPGIDVRAMPSAGQFIFIAFYQNVFLVS